MQNMFIKFTEISNRDIKKFRIILSLIMLISIVFISDTAAQFSLGVLVIIFNLLYYMNTSFKYLYLCWINLGVTLGIINSTIIFTIMYFLVFTPLGLFFRVINRDILQKKKITTSKTYWINRTSKPTSMKWQY
jgi:hypothetical protein